jgi:hypothetical protein
MFGLNGVFGCHACRFGQACDLAASRIMLTLTLMPGDEYSTQPLVRPGVRPVLIGRPLRLQCGGYQSVSVCRQRPAQCGGSRRAGGGACRLWNLQRRKSPSGYGRVACSERDTALPLGAMLSGLGKHVFVRISRPVSFFGQPLDSGITSKPPMIHQGGVAYSQPSMNMMRLGGMLMAQHEHDSLHSPGAMLADLGKHVHADSQPFYLCQIELIYLST